MSVGNLSLLWICRGLALRKIACPLPATSEKESGDKSPHSKSPGAGLTCPAVLAAAVGEESIQFSEG